MDPRAVQVLSEKLHEIVHEVVKVHEGHRIEELPQLRHDVVKVELESGCHVVVGHNDGDSVDAATCNNLINTFRDADALNQELHGLLERVWVLCEQDVSVVSKKKAKSALQDHGLSIFEVVHLWQVMRLFL